MRKINYPSHRRSPFKHHVRRHLRKNRPVRDYDRGEGSKPPHSMPRVRTSKSLTPKLTSSKRGGGFAVTIEYPDYSKENLIVTAANYPNALQKSLMERRQVKAPLSILLSKRD